jgi:FlaA1/EpsC-like NDP-sugar epimerase
MLKNNKIFIFGGTGSLGYELVKRYLEQNIIYIYSRDENKQWKMKLDFSTHPQASNLRFIVGNVSDKERVKSSLQKYLPHIIIIASAMKHIDQCELNTHESINTNLLGTKNVLDSLEEITFTNDDYFFKVVFVSSDKACSPINNYGMCKALSETLTIEKAHYVNQGTFVCVRYGNVLNSRGSIIPLLHEIGNDPNKTHFTLTHENMTRFVMTLSQSVDLIEHAIMHEEVKGGDTIIPELISMKVKDLVEIFSEKYNKPIKVTGLRPGEKMLESLINNTQSIRMCKEDGYYHIKSAIDYKGKLDLENERDYNSDINPLSKEELKSYLEKLNLI